MIHAWPSSLKKTKPRLRVLAVLQRANQPLSAAEIGELLREPGKTSWFSTVYRTLQSFMEHGLVEETTVAGSDVRRYELVRDEHQHYARCDACHKVISIDHCPIDALVHAVNSFRITGHRLELTGICADCDTKQTPREV